MSMQTATITDSATALAIDGGRPARDRPLPPWPFFAEDEVEAAARVLRSGGVNYWTGNEGREFEAEFAQYTGTRYAIALANGTNALEAALHAMELQAGDEVIVTSRTFLASASSIVMMGGVPVFADVDADSQNITADSVRAVLTPRTRAIIAVHLAGWPCDMDPIMQLADEHGIVVIEDCAQSLGALYRGRQTGSIGHIGAFSFCQDKIITTGGEGGMLTTNVERFWTRAWSVKDHGKSYDAVYHREHAPGYRWLHESFGTNWRMTEMQAAIGRVQLRKVDEWVSMRRTNAAALEQLLLQFPCVRVTAEPDSIRHAYYKYYAFIRTELLREDWSRDRIMAAVSAEGVPCLSGSCSEIYLEKAFDGTRFRPRERLPVARMLGETSLMFLVHPTIDQSDMQDVIRAVSKVLTAADSTRSVAGTGESE
jgi:dTDP-4-amino-4,6-dideoxygalactose transaminase